jgi:hypothetical protein
MYFFKNTFLLHLRVPVAPLDTYHRVVLDERNRRLEIAQSYDIIRILSYMYTG